MKTDSLIFPENGQKILLRRFWEINQSAYVGTLRAEGFDDLIVLIGGELQMLRHHLQKLHFSLVNSPVGIRCRRQGAEEHPGFLDA